MKREFRILKKLGDGVCVISTTEFDGGRSKALWCKVKVKKHTECSINGKDLYKQEAYAPVGNQSYRMVRISADIVDRELKILSREK